MAVTLRANKGSALTHAELDANFTTLGGQHGSNNLKVAGTLDVGSSTTVDEHTTYSRTGLHYHDIQQGTNVASISIKVNSTTLNYTGYTVIVGTIKPADSRLIYYQMRSGTSSVLCNYSVGRTASTSSSQGNASTVGLLTSLTMGGAGSGFTAEQTTFIMKVCPVEIDGSTFTYSQPPQVQFQAAGKYNNGTMYAFYGGAYAHTNSTVDNINFYLNSGNIAHYSIQSYFVGAYNTS